MTLKSVLIKKRASYEEDAGHYTAEIEYEGNSGTVKILLDRQVSETLLAFIGPVISKFAHQAALGIEANILQAVAEAKKLPPIELEAS